MSRTSPPRRASSRRRPRPARTRATTRYTPAGGLPELRAAVAAKTARDSGWQVDAARVLVTNGGKQAVYEAFATLLDPGDEGTAAGAVLDDVPGGHPAGGGRAGAGGDHRGAGLPGHRRAAGGGEDGAHQGAAVVLAGQPHRRGRLARRGRGGGPVGGRHRHLGSGGRDLRAPGLRRRPARVHAGRGPRARRPVRGRQRGRQDVRHDRLAGGLADRPAGRGPGRHQPAVAPDEQRGQRVAGGGPGGGARRPVGGGPRCARRSTGDGGQWRRHWTQSPG